MTDPIDPEAHGVDDLTIRRYRAADHDRVLALHEHAMRDAGAYADDADEGSEEDVALEDDLDDIEAAYLDSGGEFLVGEIDDDRTGALVAMGAFRPATAPPWTDQAGAAAAELKRMRVAPAHQRRGYGTAVLRALERAARDRGFERCVLDTTARQTAAVSFYRAHGYREERRFDWRDFEVVLMTKDLDRGSVRDCDRDHDWDRDRDRDRDRSRDLDRNRDRDPEREDDP